MKRRTCLSLLMGAPWLWTVTAAHAAKVEPFPVKGKVTVVDFGAKWCASCPEMEALMKQMQKEYGQKAAFVTIDIDEYPGIDDKYLIESMPTQIFYDAAGEPIWKHTGSVSAEQMRERVNILLSHAPQKNKS